MTADDVLCARGGVLVCLELLRSTIMWPHQKRAWSNAVQLWLVGVVCGSDAGNVCPMATGVNHNGEHVSIIVNVARKVESVLVTANM